MTTESRTLNVSIDRDPDEVYEFVSNPENLPRWATAFCKSVRKSGDTWIIETPAGAMSIRFSAWNEFRVADHYVRPTPDVEVYVPLRILGIPDGGSEVVFTVFRQPAMSDADFARDLGMVGRDLETLKSVLEQANAAHS